MMTTGRSLPWRRVVLVRHPGPHDLARVGSPSSVGRVLDDQAVQVGDVGARRVPAGRPTVASRFAVTATERRRSRATLGRCAQAGHGLGGTVLTAIALAQAQHIAAQQVVVGLAADDERGPRRRRRTPPAGGCSLL